MFYLFLLSSSNDAENHGIGEYDNMWLVAAPLTPPGYGTEQCTGVYSTSWHCYCPHFL